MFFKFDTFEERQNKFFNAMLTDLNPKIYAISADHFVFQDKQVKIVGNTGVPNAPVSVFINGVLNATTICLGDGSFSVFIRPVQNENNVVVNY